MGSIISDVDLEKFSPGQQIFIKSVVGQDVLSFRLKELGFLPGSSLEIVCWSPFKWPAIVLIRDSVIALRKEEARRLKLRKMTS